MSYVEKGPPPKDPRFEVKDSGEREKFEGGMVRDTEEGKPDLTLVFDGPMLKRWAWHLTKGAKKYAPRNWMLGRDQSALDRARRSAARHFEAWLMGVEDEDHAAGVFFNINQAEYLKGRLARLDPDSDVATGPSLSGDDSGSKGYL